MTVRLPGFEARPLRVVIDSHLRLPLESRLAATAETYPTLVLTTSAASADRRSALEGRGLEVAAVEADTAGHVDLGAALNALGARGLTRVFSEGGPRVGAELVGLGLADDVVLITAPKPLGRPGLPALSAEALARLDDPEHYQLAEVSRFEPDELRRWERRG